MLGMLALVPARGSAQTAALIAVGDATQLSEVQLAKVMADDSSLWLSVRLQGRTRLALVSAEASVESAPAADAWLRALDFATRVRVVPPPGPLASCGSLTPFSPADTGIPDSRRVAAFEVSSASSEVELRRRLADASLPVDVDRIAQFTAHAQPPFRIALYDAPPFGGSTDALRMVDRGHPGALPRLETSGASSVPLSLILLAQGGASPLGQDSADASEFPVAYRALDASSDYLSARRGWLAQNSGRWLNEAQTSDALFKGVALGSSAPMEPVIARYFAELSSAPASNCTVQVRAARARDSQNASDFTCDGADDLARSLAELGFAELRLSRFFGTLSSDGASFQGAASVPRSSLLVATDLDVSGCPPVVVEAPAVPRDPSDPPESRTPPPMSTAPVVVSAPDDPYYDPPANTPRVDHEGSCTASVSDSSSNDSCSGDSSSGDSSRDSCSGDSSSNDSCSGDSSSNDSGPDSCSGDSSESSSDSCSGDSSDANEDSGGCGKSDYDGETCLGNSSSSSEGRAKSAGLGRGASAARPRPRQVRLSLLTLLAAALALPLRRLRAWR